MPLVIVPTPVGNLDDITLRALSELRGADIIACEDTRRALKLLNHYGIKKPLISYHQHNEASRTAELIGRIEQGLRVALISDAGTPGISDPGYVLIRAAHEKGLPVDALPGASSILPALLLSGLKPHPFMFVGFPDIIGSKAAKRAKKLERLARLDATLVFFLAPHDLTRGLDFLGACLGNRNAAIVREISKVHQEAIRGTIEELRAIASSRAIKGEIVLAVAGCGDVEEQAPDWRPEALRMRSEGIFDKEIANRLFESYGISRNEAKAFLINTSEVSEDE
ncbi:MAG: 16S rRNA (cytidine(1402)-2'-O)-methyltransferase [Synergistaceae bacterium]|jgi:16S rRNA (cytidine1402-2'-O)-methyltransferase|nr:16S rRNA (cytidine(1402)-2'-O)-methyltransferase [Synergistaceae bacterium]